MQVFKFGGGIIQDAHAIEKLHLILQQYQNEKIIVVLSAINKTTNSLEKLISEFLHDKKQFYVSLEKIKSFHLEVIQALRYTDDLPIKQEVNSLFDEILKTFVSNEDKDFDFLYDQIVCYGELISSKLISEYLNQKGLENTWFDIREYLKTSNLFRNAAIIETLSRENVVDFVASSEANLMITQGFIGSTIDGFSTTLGREGSDYTAALLGNFTKSEQVVVWKDVKGVYNADPKNYPHALLIPELTYQDALELTQLGAKVLHHNSITPLQSLNIPLEVRQFDLAAEKGSIIHDSAEPIAHIPIIIHRFHKYLLKIQSKTNEELSALEKEQIFDCIRDNHMVLNFQATIDQAQYLCLNNFPELILKVMVQLSKYYHIEVFDQVCMVKVKNAQADIIEQLTQGKDLLISDLQDNIQYIFYL